MYSSISEAEYRFRREKAEEEARQAYVRSASAESADHESEENNGSVALPTEGRLRRLLSKIGEDDLLLVGLLILLFRENSDEDPLVLLILAGLLLS